jgi:pyrophosphate--fructose-6-phosphate 1-phosphotransferase
MSQELQKERLNFKPHVPQILKKLKGIGFKEGIMTSSEADQDALKKIFPNSFGRPILTLVNKNESVPLENKRVGVVFSGGQAAGGHNVIAGLFDVLKSLNSHNQLFGFIGGPSGIIEGKSVEITDKLLKEYRNMGGFDLIGSGRTKIETEEQLIASKDNIEKLQLDGLVIIGGDDSNTNAAVLAEYLLDKKSKAVVVGVPKTIDGDLRSEHLKITFGFDTACRVYSEIIGNIARDAISAKKYYHFIKLMGRSASHITLECALSTRINMALIGEEVKRDKKTLMDIVKDIADMICKRAEKGKNYGVILIPEGLIEFIAEIKALIRELNQFLSDNPNFNISDKMVLEKKLTKESYNCFVSLPKEIAIQLLLDRDPHGNVQVSKIETEKLFLELVEGELKRRGVSYKGKFNAVCHFLGYEGRAAYPSNFDAEYCYSLGINAALLINEKKTGYMSVITNLKEPVDRWGCMGIPITMLMNMEERKNKKKAVIKKALVDLEGIYFKKFVELRGLMATDDIYTYPGPIQFFGNASVSDLRPLTIL